MGLSILSGSTKVGKSWLALWLCQQVSKGDPVWEFETLKCTVLYLALEDTIDRLHFRLSHITNDGSEAMAMQFYSPIYLLQSKYVSIPQREEEAIVFLEKHVAQFCKTYGKGKNQ